MSPEAQAGFRAELEKLRANSGAGPRDRMMSLFGIAMIIVGLVIVAMSFNQAGALSDVRDQLEMLILAVLGGSLAVVGSVVFAVMSAQRFMRFWLLRVIHEQRDLAEGRPHANDPSSNGL